MDKYAEAYIETAYAFGKTSASTRLKVGCVFVRDSVIVATGLNGTIKGCHTNVCETAEGNTDESIVLHAEQNAICKAAREGQSVRGSVVYLTHAPCPTCAKLMAACEVKEVVYVEDYRDLFGVKVLNDLGIPCYRYGFRKEKSKWNNVATGLLQRSMKLFRVFRKGGEKVLTNS